MSSRKFNIIYVAISFFYYIVNACYGAFGNMFMLERSLQESQIGTVFALSSIMSLLVQQGVSTLYEKFDHVSSKTLLRLVTLMSIGAIVTLSLVSGPVLTAVFFILSWSIALTLVPILSSIFIEYKSLGYETNFNVPRASGSLAYALSAMAFGYVFNLGLTVEAINFVAIGSFLIIILLSTQLPDIPTNTEELRVKKADVADERDEFFKLENANFKYVLLGIVFLLIFHTIISSYMVQVMESRGGTAQDVGNALALSAMVEVLTLLSYGFLSKRLFHGKLLFISGLGFLTKVLILLVTTSVASVYLGQFSQIYGFALYVVAVIEYTNAIMTPNDAIKAQFNINIALTLAGIIGSLVGGYLFEYVGVQETIVFGTITSLIGVAFFYKGLKPKKTALKNS